MNNVNETNGNLNKCQPNVFAIHLNRANCQIIIINNKRNWVETLASIQTDSTQFIRLVGIFIYILLLSIMWLCGTYWLISIINWIVSGPCHYQSIFPDNSNVFNADGDSFFS